MTAAFKSAETLDNLPDIILGSAPVLTFTTQHDHQGWHVVRAGNHPWLLPHESFSIVTGAARLHVLWFLNDILFELDQQKELERMKHRWLGDFYAFISRAEQEGMSVRDEDQDAQARNHCYVGKSRFDRLRDLGRG